MLLNKSDLNKALKLLDAEADVFVPSEVHGVSRFVLWDGNGQVALGGLNTTFPPKDILFPQTEKMYAYKNGGKPEVSDLTKKAKQVICGIRPCDMRSIECLDRVFLEKGYTDSYYANKRNNLTTIALACTEAGPTCFCDSMGLDPNSAPAADLLLADAGEAYAVTAQSDKGKSVLKHWKELLKPGEKNGKKTQCMLKAKTSPELPTKLAKMFEHAIWDETGKACIGCATCTYICPTCYCFDINTESHGNEGIVFRCWDSCMFSDYSRMAGGHDPRPTKKERVRNRYMHKLSYFPERYGMLLCVGCGRCVGNCPAHMDISDFIDKVSEVPAND